MQFKIHNIPARIGSLTLIEYPDKILLMDTGSNQDYKRIDSYVNHSLRRKMGDIRLLAVSHNHPDHSAGCYALRKKYNIPIAAHPDIDKWYQGGWGRMQLFADIFFSHVTDTGKTGSIRRFWFRRMVNPDMFLQDGGPLPCFEDWVSLFTPGHTTNHMVFYNQGEKILYIGDVIVKINGKNHMPYSLPLPDLMIKTLGRLSELEVNTIIFPHGGVEHVDNMKDVLAPLYSEVYNGIKFPMGVLLRPLTRFSGEIKKLKKG